MPAKVRRSSAPEIDRLYQIPLGNFIAERNALAKRAGPDGSEIRTLPKPTVPAWAVNQLYWRQPEVYGELIERADDLRATHQAVLRGQEADLRGASRSHDEAIDRALKATLTLLADDGQPATDATRQAIVTTLRALPSGEAPGRLSRQLEPRGFEVLGGPAPRGRVKSAASASASASASAAAPQAKSRSVTPPEPATRQTARLTAAREALAAATRATREAEQIVRRNEFEVARSARDAEKAGRRVAEAEESLRQAQIELDEAQRARETTEKASGTVAARARKAADRLAEARTREQAARKRLESVS
jgi:hypothetical protein